jgi:hypothetical protein
MAERAGPVNVVKTGFGVSSCEGDLRVTICGFDE